jgi:DNA topoisomerase VI subunit B
VREDSHRTVDFGLNWTATNGDNLPYEMENALSSVRADYGDPVRFIIHIVCPRLEFKDRGKTSVELAPEIAEAITKGIEATGKPWRQAKRSADREGKVQQRELDELRRERKRKEWSIKDAACHVMPDAYITY